MNRKDFKGAVSDFYIAFYNSDDDLKYIRNILKIRQTTKDFEGAISDYSIIIKKIPHESKDFEVVINK